MIPIKFQVNWPSVQEKKQNKNKKKIDFKDGGPLKWILKTVDYR